jgi:hypothetical protein
VKYTNKAGSLLGLLLLIGSMPSHADVWCTLSGVSVEAYDHGGVYVHGILAGVNVSYIAVCGLTNGQQDCAGRAADRRYALVLAAQSAGKDLNLFFTGLSMCSQVQSNMQPTTIRMLN